ncbi:uncharacterized protein LOC118423258 [Branchiostoma floridae]|uniref:Uncharacterized protein LOC118423258 n=1 Tax=Branchiostoma floridae TaxID=7739 RepID=A0A9J7LRI8_BRAFL|nr:uncharacterized protein LOC118423258 [Branchiostoma floridae]
MTESFVTWKFCLDFILQSSKMKLALCGALFLCCVVLAAAVPSRREEELLSDLEDLVAGLKENLEVEMEMRDQEADEGMLDLQELEMEKRGLGECMAKCPPRVQSCRAACMRQYRG